MVVYGWDLRHAFARTAEICRRQVIAADPDRDNPLRQTVENANNRVALRVLDSASDVGGRALSPVRVAAALGAEGRVETGERRHRNISASSPPAEFRLVSL